MISRLFGTILTVSALILGTAPSPADEKPAPATTPRKPAASWNEVTVKYPPTPLPEGKIGTAEELKLILEAGADLKTERPIQYRRQVLQPGDYRVTIESSGGRNFFFVIGPAGEEPDEDPEGDPEEAGRAPGGARMGVAGVDVGPRGDSRSAAARDQTGKKTSPRGARKGGEEKGKATEEETDDARRGGSRGGSADEPAGKERPGDKEPAGKEPAGKEPGPQAKDAGQGKIRALFRLVKNPKPSAGVQFGVRPVDGGKRFELSVQAGSTLGRATIGFADAEKS